MSLPGRKSHKRRLHWPPRPRVWLCPGNMCQRASVGGPGISRPCTHQCMFENLSSHWRQISTTVCSEWHSMLWPSAVRTGSVTPPSLTSGRPSPGWLPRMRPASAPSVSPSPQTQTGTPRRRKLSGNIPNIFRNPPEYSTEFQEWLRQKYLPKCHIVKYRKVKHKSWKMSPNSLKYSTMTWQALGF